MLLYFWLDILNKLQTYDRLGKWQNVNDFCVLRGLKPESRRHLFFEFFFSPLKDGVGFCSYVP